MNTENPVFIDHFAQYCGIEVISISGGEALARMGIRPYHLNGLGIVQGGAVYTLADLALAAAANSHESSAVGLTANIAYFKAESSGTLYAKAVEVSLRRKVATYRVDVTNQDNDLIASFQGTVYRK